MFGPVRTPCTSNAPRMMASGGVPGMPRVRVGMKPAPTVALLAASVASTPLGSPRPKRSGVLEARKSVVSGKRVSVRVDLGGRRILKENNNDLAFWMLKLALSYHNI